MNSAAGPTSHNGFAIGKEIFDVQAKIVEGIAIEVDALLLTLGTLAKIGCGSVVVLIHWGDDFIRDLQIALVPEFFKKTADYGFILFRHGGSPYKKNEFLLARGELELPGTAGVLGMKTCTSNRRQGPARGNRNEPIGFYPVGARCGTKP
jgi:hypothetical protein